MFIGSLEEAADKSPSLRSPMPSNLAGERTVPPSSPTHSSSGSVVRVLLDTTPGIHAPNAEGIPIAIVSEYAGGGDFFVSSLGSKRMRRVSGNLLHGRLAGSAPYTDRHISEV